MARGDQIYVFREFLNIQGVYEHHGIDCGDGSVIHYRKSTETIERTSMAVFTEERKVYVQQYPTSFIPDVVVHRAKSRLGERKYNLLFNNCEHFTTWCKTGVSESRQVRDFVPAISLINTENLYSPINRALEERNPNEAMRMLNQALAEIKVVWDRVQPAYKQALHEIDVWDRVAKQALKQGREDLARAAIERKLKYKKIATKEKATLEKLATMTETLIRNQVDLENSTSTR